MIYIIVINLLLTFVIFLSYYKKELKASYISLIVNNLVITYINYPLIGVGNFISKTLVLFVTVTSVIHIYLRYYHYEHYQIYIPNQLIHLLFGLASSVCIPFIFLTSDQSLYQSSAYLSVSIFILGVILYQLSEVDRPVRWFQIDSINTYRYIKQPKQLGEIFFAISFILLTLLLPYSFVYILIGMTYIYYVKKSLLFKEK
ncbi:hypothetical protein [Macrococcoides caseolyticum]|uniref:hypothetical protein n=1 Tax=Macrococcoides caseolyticum TaxID=69966 RepID=UPI001F2750D7|nr:hypothetical protein [Macrococcus caseolyticus]MCE4955889.1 hypothetical protein [Macrococcus caseolyticus]